MKKKKKILIIIIFVCVIITILLALYFVFKQPTDIKQGLKRNNYKIIQTYKKGDVIDGYTYKGDCTIYQKEKNSVYVCEYNDFELSKAEIMEDYDQEKENGIVTDFVLEDDYIKKEVCYVGKVCNVSIGNSMYYITAFYDKNQTKKVNKFLTNFIPEMQEK